MRDEEVIYPQLIAFFVTKSVFVIGMFRSLLFRLSGCCFTSVFDGLTANPYEQT